MRIYVTSRGCALRQCVCACTPAHHPRCPRPVPITVLAYTKSTVFYKAQCPPCFPPTLEPTRLILSASFALSVPRIVCTEPIPRVIPLCNILNYVLLPNSLIIFMWHCSWVFLSNHQSSCLYCLLAIKHLSGSLYCLPTAPTTSLTVSTLILLLPALVLTTEYVPHLLNILNILPFFFTPPGAISCQLVLTTTNLKYKHKQKREKEKI